MSPSWLFGTIAICNSVCPSVHSYTHLDYQSIHPVSGALSPGFCTIQSLRKNSTSMIVIRVKEKKNLCFFYFSFRNLKECDTRFIKLAHAVLGITTVHHKDTYFHKQNNGHFDKEVSFSCHWLTPIWKAKAMEHTIFHWTQLTIKRIHPISLTHFALGRGKHAFFI